MCKYTSSTSRLNSPLFKSVGAAAEVAHPNRRPPDNEFRRAIDTQQEALYWQFIDEKQEEMSRQLEDGVDQIVAVLLAVLFLVVGFTLGCLFWWHSCTLRLIHTMTFELQ